jgi:GNAT superfamily N-acetyltransferase
MVVPSSDRSERGKIFAPRDDADMAAIQRLFRAYAESLNFDLCFQDFDAEMADFPGKYAAEAGGALLLATWDGEPVGAVALRDLGGGACEMKRLYLAPAARGSGLGRRLVEAIVAIAAGHGYRAMRLDTVPGAMDAAIALYRDIGFRDIPPYCHNPVPGAIFLELSLPDTSSA